jgi:hypothetical protein
LTAEKLELANMINMGIGAMFAQSSQSVPKLPLPISAVRCKFRGTSL